MLPDFLGYILLCLGLSRVAPLNDSIDGALSIFKKMILIDAGKWLALLWVFGIATPGEQTSSLMLWAFVFATAEVICLIPAYYKLFDGINQLGYFYDNSSIFVQGSGKKKNATDRIRRLTVVFVTMKAVLSFLPELADMTNNIGKFTNAGVKLEDAVAAIKGIANEAAVSGANANEASRAMYNFAQALSAGHVKLIDWKSIENANMATVEFKN